MIRFYEAGDCAGSLLESLLAAVLTSKPELAAKHNVREMPARNENALLCEALL